MNSDGEIRFEATIDTKKIKTLQKEMEKYIQQSNKASEELYALNSKMRQFESVGATSGEHWDKIIKDTHYWNDQLNVANGQIEAIKAQIQDLEHPKEILPNMNEPLGNIELLKKGLKSFKASISENFTNYVENARKQFDDFTHSSKRLNSVTNKLNKSVFGLGKMFKMLVLKMAMRGIIKQLREGFNNLIQYSSEANRSASMLVSSFGKLKNSLASAFMPILNALAPILTRVIDMLSDATNRIARFFGAFTGAKVVSQAIKVNKDYAKSLKGDVSRGFDELNSLNKGNENNPQNMFETVAIDDGTLNKVDKLKNLLKPLQDELEKIKLAFEPLKENIGQGLQWFLNNVAIPLSQWAMTTLFPTVLSLLSPIFNVINATIDALKPFASWLWENFLKPLGEWTGEIIINALTWLGEKLTDLATWIKDNQAIVEAIAIAVTAVATAILLVNGVLAIFNAISAITAIVIGALTSPIGLVIVAVTALIAIIVALTKRFGVSNEQITRWIDGIKQKIIALKNAVKDFFTLKAPNWLSTIGGGVSSVVTSIIPNLKMPKLATGTVVPQNSGMFSAILGDNKHETEVVSPLSTMKQALSEVLAEMDGTRTTVIELDGKVLTKVVNDENKRNSRRLGGAY